MVKANAATRRARASRRAAAALALGIAVVGGGCDSLLEVDVPGQVTEEALDNPGMAPILVSSAVADFECAYAAYVSRIALLTDEFITSAGWRDINIVDARLQDASGGTCNAGSAATTTAEYGPLHIARVQARQGYRRIEAFPADQVANRERLLATLAAFEGYGLALLGEGYCRNVLDGGPAKTRQDMWRLAETQFGVAIQHATTANDNAVLNLARTGRARVRVDLEKWAEAGADAALVPQGFVYNATYSTAHGRRNNVLHRLNRPNNFISVHPSFRNLMVGTVRDTRVDVVDGGRNGHDGVTRMFYAQKHASLSAPIPIASWREAQTILAEVRAREGQVGPAVEAINRLRTTANLPLFASTSASATLTQVFEERRRELFALGHRGNELLRLKLTWEQGTTPKGEPYGHVTCMELPEAEINSNPNL